MDIWISQLSIHLSLTGPVMAKPIKNADTSVSVSKWPAHCLRMPHDQWLKFVSNCTLRDMEAGEVFMQMLHYCFVYDKKAFEKYMTGSPSKSSKKK